MRSLIDVLELSTDELNESDIESALEAYDKGYYCWKLADVESTSGLRIERNKRNGRKQQDHVKLMNFVRDEINRNETWNKVGNGRKPSKDIVIQYRREHPDAKPKECIEQTGLSKNTVYKWWKEIK